MVYIVRNIKDEKQFDILIEWVNKQNWNSCPHDHKAFRDMDREGFWVGELDGQIIAFLCAIAYDQNFGFVGYYIVKAPYRGKGYGLQIWNKALSRVKNRNLALQAVLQQQKNYTKSGFKTHHKTIRYETLGKNSQFESQNLKSIDEVDYKQLLKYDQPLFPSDRSNILKVFLNLPETSGYVFLEDSKVRGYGVVRPCLLGVMIGPLFADTKEIAQTIFIKFLSEIKQDVRVFIDVPQINKEAIQLFKKYQMKIFSVYARMYTKQVPKVPVDKFVFGITTSEFG